MSSVKKRRNSSREDEDVNEMSYLDMIPDVVLIEILSYLHATEVAKVTAISKRLRDLSRTPTGSRRINLSQCLHITFEGLQEYFRPITRVMTGALDLSQNPWIPAKSFERLTHFMVNITSLDITGCCISVPCLNKILCKATKLHTLALTDRGFHFITSSEEGSSKKGSFTKKSLQTLSRIRHLTIAFLMCSEDLSLVVHCPRLEALRIDLHVHEMPFKLSACYCSLENLPPEHFCNLRRFTQTNVHSIMHPHVTNHMGSIITASLLRGTKFTKLFLPTYLTENEDIAEINKMNTSWSSSLSHADLPFELKGPVPSLRYLRTDYLRYKNVEDLKQFPNLQYLFLSPEADGKLEFKLDLLPILADSCPHLIGLCLPDTHIHPKATDDPVAMILGRFKKLQHLSISPCAFQIHNQANHSIFDTKEDIADKNTAPTSNESPAELLKDISGLVKACPFLTELELIYPQTKIIFISNGSSAPVCSKESTETVPTDTSLAAIGNLKFLQRLTIGGALGIRHGGGFLRIFKECRQLYFLSLADIGLSGQCTWMPAFCEALRYASSLRDLRVEHQNLELSTQFQLALQNCKRLRRLFLHSQKRRIQKSKGGNIYWPQCGRFLDLLRTCPDLHLLAVFSADPKTMTRLGTDESRLKKSRLEAFFGLSFPQCRHNLRFDNINWREFVVFGHHVCDPPRIIVM
nr:F-box/LRR-repeat protein 18-like [Lytechinus pictus]